MGFRASAAPSLWGGGAGRAVLVESSPADGSEMFGGKGVFPNLHNGPKGWGSKEAAAQAKAIRKGFLEEAAT